MRYRSELTDRQQLRSYRRLTFVLVHKDALRLWRTRFPSRTDGEHIAAMSSTAQIFYKRSRYDAPSYTDNPRTYSVQFAIPLTTLVANIGCRVCYVCGKDVPTGGSCAKCSGTVYCSRSCQKKDWPRHKALCALERVGCNDVTGGGHAMAAERILHQHGIEHETAGMCAVCQRASIQGRLEERQMILSATHATVRDAENRSRCSV